MDRTTDLDKLRQGEKFTWGELIAIHDIGDYSVVEYHSGKRDGIRILVDVPDTDVTEYSCYLKGQYIGRGTDSLDSALATCIAYKRDGNNSRAAAFFMKMIGGQTE